MKKLMLMVVAMLFVVSSASAGVDEMYYDGVWKTVVDKMPGTYVSITADGVDDYHFYGAKAGGGVDEIYYSGGVWNTVVDKMPGTYVSLTADATREYLIYGAKAGGGVDEMQSVTTGKDLT